MKDKQIKTEPMPKSFKVFNADKIENRNNMVCTTGTKN